MNNSRHKNKSCLLSSLGRRVGCSSGCRSYNYIRLGVRQSGRAGCTLFATAAAAVVGGVDYTASKKRCNDVLFQAGSEALRSAGRRTADFAQVAVVELISVMYSHHTELGKGADLRWREIALQGQARYVLASPICPTMLILGQAWRPTRVGGQKEKKSSVVVVAKNNAHSGRTVSPAMPKGYFQAKSGWGIGAVSLSLPLSLSLSLE